MNKTQDILLTIVCFIAILTGVLLTAVAVAPWESVTSNLTPMEDVESEYLEVRTIVVTPTTICDSSCLDSYYSSTYLEK